MDVEKCPSLQMAHLRSDLQGQNPGVVGVLGCFLCLNDLLIFRPLGFLHLSTHSGQVLLVGEVSFSGVVDVERRLVEGGIGEIICFHRGLTNKETLYIHQYLIRKWGIIDTVIGDSPILYDLVSYYIK